MVDLRPEVLRRLLLARGLYRAGASARDADGDVLQFTMGILSLHDAAEAGLGAFADHLHARWKGERRPTLMAYFDAIEEADPERRRLPYRTQIANLNELRNNAKHSGIFPNPQTDAHFPDVVLGLLTEGCEWYLGRDFLRLSLVHLVRRARVRDELSTAETRMASGQYRESIEACARDVPGRCSQ